MTSTNHFRNRDLGTNLRSPVSPRRRRRATTVAQPQPTSVSIVLATTALAYTCPVNEGFTDAPATKIGPVTWRRERNVYGAVFIATEVDFLPESMTVNARGYIKCSGTWVQVADYAKTDWNGLYPLNIITTPMNVTAPNVTEVDFGLDATSP